MTQLPQLVKNFLKKPPSYFIGIAPQDNASARVATVKVENRNIVFESLQTLDSAHLAEMFPVKLFYSLGVSETTIASGLLGSSVFIRKLHLPLKQKSKILASLPFQLEALLPFAPETSIVCPLIKSFSQSSSVTLFATTQESLERHLQQMKTLKLTANHVSCAPQALFRFTRYHFPKNERILSFHAENQHLLYIVCENDEILFSQTLVIQEERLWKIELEKLSIFLKQKGLICDETAWLLTGEIQLHVLFASLFSHNALAISQHSAFAIPIGYALDALAKDQLKVQFCQKNFTPDHTLNKRQKWGWMYLGASALSCMACLLLNGIILSKKEKRLTEVLNRQLPSSLALSSFSYERTEEALDSWEKLLNKQRSAFPFFVTVPKVSDILAWMSTHPSFAAADGNKVEGIEVQSLHYQLVKYPKIGEASAPYQGLLDVHFTAETPRLARHFHEALLKGDEIVNEKKEIKWQAQNQTYFTSFELKKVPRS